MRLLTIAQNEQLLKNGMDLDNFRNLNPVVKISLPGENGFTWILSAIDPDDTNTAYGFYIGPGEFSTYGPINLNALLELRNDTGFGVQVDMNFKPKFALSVYHDAEWDYGRLIEDEQILRKFLMETSELQPAQLCLF